MMQLLVKDKLVDAITKEEFPNAERILQVIDKLPKVMKLESEWEWTLHEGRTDVSWYVKCKHCGKTNKTYVSNYCPNCGFHMKKLMERRPGT